MAAITLQKISGAGLPGPGVDLTIGDREFVVLTGPDQTALSAILRMVAGLEPLGAGEICFDQRRLNDLRPHQRPVGFIPRDFVPYPRLSVGENILLGLKVRKFGSAEAEKRTQEAAELLGLQALLRSKPGELSPEQRQRVGFARAVAQQPKVYLFDEPFAGLPADGQRRGRAEIAKLRDRATATILYATTDAAEALALGGRIVFLDGGAIQQSGETQAVLAAPATMAVAKFFGDPPMNFIQGALKATREGLTFSEAGEGTIAIPLPSSAFSTDEDSVGKPVVLGIRPGDLRLAGTGTSEVVKFRALIERFELNSDGVDLYLQTGAHDLVCRSERGGEGGGRRAEFELDVARMHFFDATSGARLAAET